MKREENMSVLQSRFRSQLDSIDLTLVRIMSAYGIHALRWAVAIIYIWFGGLKLINESPAAELVVQTVFWLPQRAALLFIGGWEVLVGIGLLFSHPLILRATLFLLWLQVAGTFQVFFVLPEAVFQRGNPLLPTLEGQYAIKNLVLVTGGLVIGSTVRRHLITTGRIRRPKSEVMQDRQTNDDGNGT